MLLQDISEDEIQRYIEENLSDEEYEEYDSRKNVRSILKSLDSYIDSMRKSADTLRQLFDEDMPNSYFINGELHKFNRLLKRTVNKSNELGLYSGISGKKKIQEIVGEELKMSMDGEKLHIEFPTLLPKKIERFSNKAVYTNSDIRQMYEPSFTRFFSRGKHIIYSKKAAIIYTHFFTSEKEFMDHDNFETKIITDFITSNLLLDDSPKHCAILMDYKMGEKSHTEVDVVPFDGIQDFFDNNQETKQFKA